MYGKILRTRGEEDGSEDENENRGDQDGEDTLRIVRVDTGGGEVVDLISSKVWNFRSSRGEDGVADENKGEIVKVTLESYRVGGEGGVLQENEEAEEVEANLKSQDQDQGQGLGRMRTSGNVVEKTQLLEAAEEILRSGGLSLKDDGKELMKKVVNMKEEARELTARNRHLFDEMGRISTMLDKAGNEAFLCPITRDVMVDPVVCADGHTYERASIAKWLEMHVTSPKTNARLPNRNLLPNHALRQQIESSEEQREEIKKFLDKNS